tara:strand:- start:195 stop:572 length:378 start_codon:yes stop_codon:yes gene_type:complete
VAIFDREQPVGKRLDFYARDEANKMQAYLICAKTTRKFWAMFTAEEYKVRRIENSGAPVSFEEFKEQVRSRIDNFEISRVHHLHDLIEEGKKTEAIDYFFTSRKAWITNQPDSEIALKGSRRRRG